MKKTCNVLCALAALLSVSSLLAAAEGPEDYRLELSASLWRMNTNGTIHGDGMGINLLSDLGVFQRQRIYDGRLVFRFRRKERLVLEGMPISAKGLNTIQRTFTYFGNQYSVNEILKSSGQMNYIYGGFHHDWLRGSLGRFGSSIGAAYLGVASSLQGEPSGLSKKESIPFGLPLAGVDFRLYFIPNKRWIALEGAVRGLPAAGYGHWVEGTAGLGGWIGPVGLQLGYREMLIDLHQNHFDPNGLNLRFQGPMATLLWNW
jgi:hypothetical protein